MAKSLTIIENSENRSEIVSFGFGTQCKKPKPLRKLSIRNIFNSRRLRINTVYALLVAAIFFTMLNAVLTCIENKEKDIAHNRNADRQEQGFLPRDPDEFSPVKCASFVLLALTCSLALATIIKKDKSNGRLLSKLRSTNRKLENEVGKRTSELAKAIKAKDHFIGIATHDLKAPLNGILGLLELIKMENNNPSAPEAEYLAHIEYSCKKMQLLIQDILEINRFEQGKATVKREKVDLVFLVKRLRFNFEYEAAKKNIDLIFEECYATIQTDADSLTRILENLLSNAIKFSPRMKKVRLRVSVRDLIKFEVEDEGPGIPLEEQPKLFNKFQKLSNRPTNSEISTGLGLSIVRQLTTQLGGEITFKTEVGKGSTFIVTLPNNDKNFSEAPTTELYAAIS